MTTFEERLARLEKKQSAQTVARPAQPQAESPAPSIGPGAVLTIPLALGLGALAIVIGGIIEINVVQDGMTPNTAIPPAFSIVSFLPALLMAFLADKLFGGSKIGPLFVTVGFIGMVFGEWWFAETFPTLWYAINALDPSALMTEVPAAAPASAPAIGKTG